MENLHFKAKEIRQSNYYKKIIELEKTYFNDTLKPIYDLDDYIEFNVTISDGILTGYMAYKIHGEDCEVYNIAVDNKYQKHGIGSLLISLVSNYNIYLEVSENNENAIKLYEKHGFKVYNSVSNYYGKHSCLKMMLLNNKGEQC